MVTRDTHFMPNLKMRHSCPKENILIIRIFSFGQECLIFQLRLLYIPSTYMFIVIVVFFCITFLYMINVIILYI